MTVMARACEWSSTDIWSMLVCMRRGLAQSDDLASHSEGFGASGLGKVRYRQARGSGGEIFGLGGRLGLLARDFRQELDLSGDSSAYAIIRVCLRDLSALVSRTISVASVTRLRSSMGYRES